MSDKAHGSKKRRLIDTSGSRRGRRIGTLELAAKLNCHPMSIPRFVKQGRLPKPKKPFGKNIWDEDEIDELIGGEMAGEQEVA